MISTIVAFLTGILTSAYPGIGITVPLIVFITDAVVAALIAYAFGDEVLA